MFFYLNKTVYFFSILIISSSIYTSTSSLLAKETEKIPGLISSLELLVKSHKKQYQKLRSAIRLNPKILSEMGNIKSININRYFLRSILLHSNYRYLQLIKKDECTFYALLENGLLKTAAGPINNIIIDFTTNDNKVESAIISKSDFFSDVYSKKCFDNKARKTLFSNTNIKKTVKTREFPIPKGQEDCYGILEKWTNSLEMPYLCQIPETIHKATIGERLIKNLSYNQISLRRYYNDLIRRKKFYQQNVPFFHLTYLNNLCFNLDNKEKFCSLYLTEDIWSKVINGELPTYLMSYRCKEMGLKQINNKQLSICAKKLNSKIEICTKKNIKSYPSIFPSPNCKSISNALKLANLKTDYQDCPGNIDNEAITNIHRIIMHLKDRKVESSLESCANETNYSFANLAINSNHKKAWPLQICYQDLIKEEEICLHYVPGHGPTNKLSETHVVAKILAQTKGAPETPCKFIEKNEYAPTLLKYKHGCFIVAKINQCTALYCKKKIYYNQKEVKNLKYKGRPLFDYFPNSYLKSKFSLTNLLEETYKIRPRIIKNLPETLTFLKIKAKRKPIVHGIGCLEDLLPSFFRKKKLNECRPMPFIIDGYHKKNTNTYLTVRLPLDNIHSPRLINWQFIFSALRAFREIHPLNLWTLYGIK